MPGQEAAAPFGFAGSKSVTLPLISSAIYSEERFLQTAHMPKLPRTAADRIVTEAHFPGRDWATLAIEGLRKTPLRRSSRRVYEAMWRAYLVFLAKQGLDALTATQAEAEAFLGAYAASSAARRAKFLMQVYEAAIATQRASSNPFLPVQAWTRKEPRGQVSGLESQTIGELITALPESPDWQVRRDQAAVVLGVAAGLRWQELRELELSAVIELSTGFELGIHGRTALSRNVSLEPAAAEHLKMWLSIRPRLGRYVFPAPSGGPLTSVTLYRRLRAVLKDLRGMQRPARFGAGVLRATFARGLLSKSIVETRYALGHRNVTSTLRYLEDLNLLSKERQGEDLRLNSE